MATAADQLPDDVDALKAALREAHALIEHLQLVIAKMKRELFGPRSERSQRLIDQLELQLEELVAAAGEDEAKARRQRCKGTASPGARRRGAISPPICRADASFTQS